MGVFVPKCSETHGGKFMFQVIVKKVNRLARFDD